MKTLKLIFKLIIGFLCGYVMFLSLYALADKDFWMFMGMFFCPASIILALNIHKITIKEIKEAFNLK